MNILYNDDKKAAQNAVTIIAAVWEMGEPNRAKSWTARKTVYADRHFRLFLNNLDE